LFAALAALGCFLLAVRPGRRATPATFFDEDDRRRIQAAIAAAEDRTSGEIRVHLEPRTPGDPLSAARTVFDAIGMSKTRARTGVLIYISVSDRQVAILGDEGIHRVVPEGYWDDLLARLRERFREDRCAEGVVEAAEAIGEKLHRHFPVQPEDRNELPDEISMGNPPPRKNP
jgi:uncharacterized membrane protein